MESVSAESDFLVRKQKENRERKEREQLRCRKVKKRPSAAAGETLVEYMISKSWLEESHSIAVCDPAAKTVVKRFIIEVARSISVSH